MPPAREFEALVNQFQHDSHRKRSAEALHTLQKIASIVKPIMRQRNWHVGTLAEFYPADTHLLGLNINHGMKICLRLRDPFDQNQFVPLEQVIDTMLHELVHIVHGPHDQHFNALWNQLRDEHEALVSKGYTGEGFLGQGNRLGGRRIPMDEARRIARINAEKRRTLTAGSGQRLGGSGIRRGQDPRKAIIDAIERRTRIEKGCASETEQGRKIARDVEQDTEGVTMTRAKDDDANEELMMQAYIDLVQEEDRQKYGSDYNPPSELNPAGMRSAAGSSPSPNALKAQQISIEQAIRGTKPNVAPPSKSTASTPRKTIPPLPSPSPAIPTDTWTCEICTLVNPLTFLACDACGVERPSTASPPQPQDSRAHLAGRDRPATREIPNALKPRLNATDSLARIDAQAAAKLAGQPIGWTCVCSNFMANEWWTCSVCWRMRQSS